MDKRYSITREWCGHATRRWVARFCGEWIGQDPDKSGALMLCLAHSDAREASMRDVTPSREAPRGGIVDVEV